MLFKDLITMIDKYNMIKDKINLLKKYDPSFNQKEEIEKQEAEKVKAMDMTSLGVNIDPASTSKDSGKTLILKLEKIINEMDTDTLTKI